MDLGYLNIPFIYKGSDLVYPSPIKDGLVLWYDFSGMSNSFENRDIATDLSGNGNHGTLQNFAYSEGSGYDKRGLLFDGVDDYVVNPDMPYPEQSTVCVTFRAPGKSSALWSWGSSIALTVRNNGDIHHIEKRREPDRNTESSPIEVGKIYNLTTITVGVMTEVFLQGEFLYRFEADDLVEWRAGANLNIGHLINNLRMDEAIYSFHLYNRPLTPEEIQHNYTIEKERFGIGGSEL